MMDNTKLEIKGKYQKIRLNIFISFFTSYLGGFLAAIMVAVLLGQNPLEEFKSFGTSLLTWAIIFTIVFLIFLIIFFLFTYLYQWIEIKDTGRGPNLIFSKLRRLGIVFWVMLILAIIISIYLISNGMFLEAVRVFITMILFMCLIRVVRLNYTPRELKKISETESKDLSELRLNKYQTFSIAAISLGTGIFLYGFNSGKIVNYTSTWIGILMIIAGIFVLIKQVDVRYKILEDKYLK